MDDLIKFLLARYDEDEAAARNAGGETWDFTGKECQVRVRPSGRKEYGDFGRIIAYTRHGNPLAEDLALAIHVSWHDPARVLREVEAKRKRIATYQAAAAAADRYDDQYMAGVAHGLAEAIKDDAAAWSTHQGYRPEWAPA